MMHYLPHSSPFTFSNGLHNLSEAFSSEPHDLATRISHFVAGFFLMIPLLHIVTYYLLKFCATPIHPAPQPSPVVVPLPPVALPPVLTPPHPLPPRFAPTWSGAGVLPYYVDAHGEAWVLLGKERAGSTHSNSWCDFGGSKDPNEMPIDTARRESDEESHGLLRRGNATPLSYDRVIGRYYGMFFSEVRNPEVITQHNFTHAVSSDQEKTKIAWVRASSLLAALSTPTPNDRVYMHIDGHSEWLRPPFVNLVRRALTIPQDRALLGHLFAPGAVRHPVAA